MFRKPIHGLLAFLGATVLPIVTERHARANRSSGNQSFEALEDRICFSATTLHVAGDFHTHDTNHNDSNRVNPGIREVVADDGNVTRIPLKQFQPTHHLENIALRADQNGFTHAFVMSTNHLGWEKVNEPSHLRKIGQMRTAVESWDPTQTRTYVAAAMGYEFGNDQAGHVLALWDDDTSFGSSGPGKKLSKYYDRIEASGEFAGQLAARSRQDTLLVGAHSHSFAQTRSNIQKNLSNEYKLLNGDGSLRELVRERFVGLEVPRPFQRIDGRFKSIGAHNDFIEHFGEFEAVYQAALDMGLNTAPYLNGDGHSYLSRSLSQFGSQLRFRKSDLRRLGFSGKEIKQLTNKNGLNLIRKFVMGTGNKGKAWEFVPSSREELESRIMSWPQGQPLLSLWDQANKLNGYTDIQVQTDGVSPTLGEIYHANLHRNIGVVYEPHSTLEVTTDLGQLSGASVEFDTTTVGVKFDLSGVQFDPTDANRDGLADVLEDRNRNGVPDIAEAYKAYAVFDGSPAGGMPIALTPNARGSLTLNGTFDLAAASESSFVYFRIDVSPIQRNGETLLTPFTHAIRNNDFPSGRETAYVDQSVPAALSSAFVNANPDRGGTGGGGGNSGSSPDWVVSHDSIVVSEHRSTATFAVHLAAEPKQRVVVDVVTQDASEVEVLTRQLSFDPGNYSVPQQVSVRGVDDLIIDGTVGSHVALKISQASSPEYRDLKDHLVTTSTTDNDTTRLTYALKGSQLIVNGTAQDDTVLIRTVGQNTVLYDGKIQVRTYGGVRSATIRVAQGHDHVSLGDFIGTATVFAGAGNDTIVGGHGADNITGGPDNDVISGGPGDDTIVGNEGLDRLSGDSGDDSITGNEARDHLDGGAGNDTLQAGKGNDTVLGGTGEDHLYGGQEADSLDGGAGNDNVHGEDGNDTLRGSTGNDTLYGNSGNDVLFGVTDTNWLYGGLGNDKLVGGNETDVAYGGDGSDTIDGGAGNDTLYGGLSSDSISGGAGFDALYGNKGSDTLSGGFGIDTLFGGLGADLLDADKGSDLLSDREKKDRVFNR